MNNESFLIAEPGFILAVKLTAGVTSILSILGASLIIFTYVVFDNLRTTARQLLVSISIADIIVSTSHLVGLFANFDRFINNETWNESQTDPLCVSQAAFSMFGTLASFMLSLAIGVYLVGLSIWSRRRVWKKILPVIYIVCWGIPVIMIIPNAVKHYFGFVLGADIGWCYMAYMSKQEGSEFIVAGIFSYEIWVYSVFAILPTLYIIAFVYIRCKIRRNKYKSLSSSSSPSQREDLKLLFVPIIFLLLRIWSTALDLYISYGNDPLNMRIKTPVAAALLVLAGIGDNGQGFVNAVLFCIFTKQVRQQLFTKQLCTKVFHNQSTRQPQSAVDENTHFTKDRQFYENRTQSYGSSIQTSLPS